MSNLSQRGRTWYYDGTYGEKRLRFSLGINVRDSKAAARLANRVTFAISDGPRSGVWSELQRALPLAAWETLVREFRLQQCPALGTFERTYYDKIERRLGLGEIALNTRNLYQRVAERFFARLSDIGVRELDEVSASVIEAYLLWRKEQIQTRTPGSAARSLVTERTVLATIFNLAVEEGAILVSPVKDFVRPDADRKGAEPFTDAELWRMQEQAGDDLLVFLIFRWTGLRVSDVADLRWSSVNWTERNLKVKTRKRGVTVTIPISEELFSLLYDSRSEPDQTILEANRSQLYQKIRALGSRAGVLHAHPHRFRANLASWLLSHGASLWDVSQILGDSTSVVEQYYGRIVDGYENRIRSIINKTSGERSCKNDMTDSANSSGDSLKVCFATSTMCPKDLGPCT